MASLIQHLIDGHLVGGVRLDEFIQLTVNGLTLGSVYALIALGYSLVYGILKLLNFAHGDVFMVGTFIGFGMLQLLGGAADPMLNTWLLLVVITARRDGGLRCARRRRSSASPTGRCVTRRGSHR